MLLAAEGHGSSLAGLGHFTQHTVTCPCVAPCVSLSDVDLTGALL